MEWLAQLDATKLLLFTLVLARISGLMVTAPVFGSADVPARVRALAVVAIALVMMPSQWHVEVEDPGTTLNYLVVMASELAVGLCLGLGVMILFSGIQLAGQLIGRIGGMMLADVFDPGSGESMPLFSKMLMMTALAVFLTIGGHRMVMAGLLDTFATIPPGSGAMPVSIGETLVVLITQSFALGIRAAAPVVTSLLLATLVLGLISRTLPQLNILAVGFGLNAMLMFGTMSLALGATVWVFQQQVEPALELLLEALHAPLHTEWMS